ncbi:MAG: CIA30 family protein [Pseudomonadota bacterium]
MLTSFDNATPDLGWRVVNDNVMGGRSEGSFSIKDGILSFAGRTNTDGGGFSSIRALPSRLDMGGSLGIALRVRGDGRTYTFRLETTRSVAYWAEFRTSGGDWETVNIPYDRFIPRWRGRVLAAPLVDPAEVVSLGIMIYDGKDGEFRLDVDWIGTVMAQG